MCGRLALFTPPTSLARLLDANLGVALQDELFVPRWNLPPTVPLPGLLNAPNGSGRVLSQFRWGLLPSWAKDRSFASRTFNARSETVATKPSFRSAFTTRHLLVPVDGYFEWTTTGPVLKEPHYISRIDGKPALLAGLWEEWRDPEAPEGTSGIVRTCTVLTRPANADVAHLHDRMPVIVEDDSIDRWLTATGDEAAVALQELLNTQLGMLKHHSVSRAVGSIRNDDASLIEAVASPS
ncbi:MAG: SOS response-associated peptidase [Actinomycetota bacterium]